MVSSEVILIWFILISSRIIPYRYDYSGEFAFTMGFPCKSGVGGALMIVIPNVMGICTFSPRLDPIGNSVRGVAFCRRLITMYVNDNHIID